MRRHCLLIICCAFWLSAGAQNGNYAFAHIDSRHGLSYNDINAIFKDAKGFMWFGTMSGLDRFDGREFKVFRHDESDTASIGDNTIRSIAEGPDHKLWIHLMNNQFNIYDPLTESFNRRIGPELKRLGIPDSAISEVVKDAKGRYWFVHPTLGLFLYNGRTAALVHVPGHNCQTDNISDFTDDNHGHYWIVRASGLLQELGPDLNPIYTSDTLVGGEALSLNVYADTQGDLWLYSTLGPKGIYCFHTNDHTIQHFGIPRLNNNLVRDVIEDNAGDIWIATDGGGVNLLDKKTGSIRYLQHNDFDENSLSQNVVTCLYKDNTGIVWLGTYKQGVNFYHPAALRFPLYRHNPFNPNSLGFDDVNRFVEDPRGNLWIGTNGGGLIYFDRHQNHFTTFRHQPGNPNSISNDVIISMCMDHEGKLWIGSYFGGLDCYDGKTFTHYLHDPKDSTSLADDRVWEIFEDKWHQLWVGMLAGGLDLMDREHHRFIHHTVAQPGSIQSNYISELVQDTAGNLWVGTSGGIDRLDHRTGLWRHYGKPEGLSSIYILTIVPDSLGRVWVGTNEGLNLLDPATGKVVRVWTKDDGLPDNYILTILEDNAHNLWLGSPAGLCNAIVQPGPGVPGLKCINYDESNGLQARQFNENAAYRTREGELVFGGPDGFNIFNPGGLYAGGESPALVFTDLRIFNKSVAPGDYLHGHKVLTTALPETQEISLRYNENVFTVSFADLDYSGNQKTVYSYRLEGFDQDWLLTSGQQRSATYTNLDPGTYVFYVRAVSALDNGRPREATLTIHVLPPFWRTPWAFTLYALFIAGLLLLSRNIIVERARMRFRIEQERKEAQQMHELDMMKIRFFTNVSHEFRTPLSLILAPLEKLLKGGADPEQKRQFQLIYRNARRLLNLVNQLLDFRRMEVQEFTLHRTRGNIVRFVQDLVQSFSDISEKRNISLGFQTSLPECWTWFDRDKLEKIVFNLLSNAFKFTPEGGAVRVETGIEDGQVVIRVADTGIGIPLAQQERIFERFFQHDLPAHLINQGSGIGLALTKEFVKLHQGSISVESEPEKGSVFTVRLPIVEETASPKAALHEDGEAVKAPAGPMDQGASGAAADAPAPPRIVTDDDDPRPAKGRKPVLLLVEDNEDFRFYLKDNLSAHYQIAEAANGKEGWSKLQAVQPDLVVSDIMMPEMDGIALARKIHNDPRTSHIPVILLTARADEEQQLEGYETGASDYITKPFNFELLLAKIRSLLAQRKAMHKLFQKQAEISPSSIAITSLDEQFLKDALAAVEASLGDPDFSVEDLSRALHLSRVTLYKKLLSLTGKAPLDFIRHIRLKRAADLLAKSQLTVAEIAYKVGYNNPKYFAKYFKKEFGVQPSAYKSLNK